MYIQSALLSLGLASLATAVVIPGIQQATSRQVEEEIYDAIVVRIISSGQKTSSPMITNTQQVGGGPSGLSALSGLARVRRKAIMIDSGAYRNNATRHMHDVIGLDGE